MKLTYALLSFTIAAFHFGKAYGEEGLTIETLSNIRISAYKAVINALPKELQSDDRLIFAITAPPGEKDLLEKGIASLDKRIRFHEKKGSTGMNGG